MFLDSGFSASTDISQLAMVPLQDQHSANSIIEQDRMLLVSGSLVSTSFGNASSVLFDGQSFFPYITSSTATGAAGFVASLFTSISNFSFEQRRMYTLFYFEGFDLSLYCFRLFGSWCCHFNFNSHLRWGRIPTRSSRYFMDTVFQKGQR